MANGETIGALAAGRRKVMAMSSLFKVLPVRRSDAGHLVKIHGGLHRSLVSSMHM
jgi:hypothetical protein